MWGKRTGSGSRSSLTGRQRVLSGCSPATREQEAVPGRQQPSDHLVSGTGCKRDVTTEQSENSGMLQSGPRVRSKPKCPTFNFFFIKRRVSGAIYPLRGPVQNQRNEPGAGLGWERQHPSLLSHIRASGRAEGPSPSQGVQSLVASGHMDNPGPDRHEQPGLILPDFVPVLL